MQVNPFELIEFLVDVSKVQILAIGHVAESRRIQVSTLESTLLLSLQSVTALIFPRQDDAKEKDDANLDQMADNHAPDAQRIFWSLRRQVEERSDDISCAVTEEKDGCRSLSVSNDDPALHVYTEGKKITYRSSPPSSYVLRYSR